MSVKQISVFVENKSGRLAEIASILRENQIDIRALTLADTTKFGILRLIVNDPEKTLQILRDAGMTVSLTSVIVIAVQDKPGGLCGALGILSANNIDVEYMYAFISRDDTCASVIFRVAAEELASKLLTENGFRLLEQEDIYQLTK